MSLHYPPFLSLSLFVHARTILCEIVKKSTQKPPYVTSPAHTHMLADPLTQTHMNVLMALWQPPP